MTIRTSRVVAALAAAGLLAGCGAQGVPEARESEPTSSSTTQTSPTPEPTRTTSSSTSSSSSSPSTSTSTTTQPSTSTTTATPTPTETPEPTATETPTPEPTTTPAEEPSTPAPSPEPTQTPTPTPTPEPTPEETTLRPGDSGPAVLELQQQLSALGYWLGTPDAGYGHLTVQAVMALQGSAGLGRDGIAGPSTRAALERGVRPPVQGGPANRIEIDLARQVLLVVRGGAVKYVLHTSTGSGEEYISSQGEPAIATTPPGSFSVFRSVDGWDEAKLGTLYRPRYFHRGIAVHGLGSVPGYPASHGCARVSNPAMDLIWAQNLMPVGSAVIVH